jgi:hypothetical protein
MMTDMEALITIFVANVQISVWVMGEGAGRLSGGSRAGAGEARTP